MASDLFKSFGKAPQNVPAQQNAQNPKDAAIQLMRQRGMNVPQNISNNPSAIIEHLIQSGQIPQNRLAMVQQMILQRMGRK